MRVTNPEAPASEVVKLEWWYGGKAPDERPNIVAQWLKIIAMNWLVEFFLSGWWEPSGDWVLSYAASGEIIWNTGTYDRTVWPEDVRRDQLKSDVASMTWAAFAEKYGLAS